MLASEFVLRIVIICMPKPLIAAGTYRKSCCHVDQDLDSQPCRVPQASCIRRMGISEVQSQQLPLSLMANAHMHDTYCTQLDPTHEVSS